MGEVPSLTSEYGNISNAISKLYNSNMSSEIPPLSRFSGDSFPKSTKLTTAISDNFAKIDIPHNLGKTNIPKNFSKTTTPKNFSKVGVPEGYGKIDVPKGYGKIDVPENFSKNFGKIDVPENFSKNFGKIDVPENFSKNFGKIDVPENFGKIDVPKGYGKIDVPKGYGKIDVPENFGKVNVPKNFSKTTVPEAFDKQPTSGIREDLSQTRNQQITRDSTSIQAPEPQGSGSATQSIEPFELPFSEFSPSSTDHYEWPFLDLRGRGPLISLQNDIGIESIASLNRQQAAIIGYPVAFLLVFYMDPRVAAAITFAELIRKKVSATSE